MDVSGISYGGLSRSAFEERNKNAKMLRVMYGLVVVEMVVALLWSIWVREHDRLGQGVYDYWGFALFTAIMSGILLLAATFVGALRRAPVNTVIYAFYTIFAAYTWGYCCSWDQRKGNWEFVFYWLCLLTAISVVLFFQVLGSGVYQYSLKALLWIMIACSFVFFLFLCFTKISFLKLICVTIPIVVYGYFMSYNVRRMVRGSLYGGLEDDAPSGAVRIWLEAVFVVCRLVELIAGMFTKH